MRHLVCITAILLIVHYTASAQRKGWLFDKETDSAYISDYSQSLTLRLFLSQKLSSYQTGREDERNEVEYSPNGNTNIGVGFVHRWLGINVGFKMPFINNDDDKYGDTKLLDLASFIYLRRVVFDLNATINKGYYLSDNDFLERRLATGQRYIRPDIRTQDAGINGQYIFNHKRFSYRASFLQNEWQKKSAGSPFVGAGIRYSGIRGDSAIVPLMSQNTTNDPFAFNRSSIVNVGLTVGYAHTFVLKKHWFATLAAGIGPGIGFTTLKTETPMGGDTYSKAGFMLNGSGRAAVGYNSERWFAGLYYVNTAQSTTIKPEDDRITQRYSSGIVRLVAAYRIPPRRKAVDAVDKVIDRVEDTVTPESKEALPDADEEQD